MLASRLSLEILLIFALILLNGVFAMSEIAIVSSRKPRLQQRADAGDVGARRALELAESPTRFLSTVQLGITLIGVFAAAYGGASIAGQFDTFLERFPALSAYSEEIALGIVVVTITFFSLVLGELVPKRVGLNHPERIASLVAGPMHLASLVAAPLVHLLSGATELLLRVLHVRKSDEPAVTEADMAALLEQGTASGVFEEEEQDLVERVFLLGDRPASAVMTPRHRIEWLDVRGPPDAHREELIRHRFSHYLVCDGDVDHVLGMVRVKDLFAELLAGQPLDLRAALRNPLYVPENLPALRLLELFRESGVHMAVVLDEFGGVEGLITVKDVLEEIVGDLSTDSVPRMTQRNDGSWLVDGSLTMDEFWERVGLEDRRGAGRAEYHTLGGLVITNLGRIPRVTDSLEAHGLRFEVVDMDGHRVDKVLVSRSHPSDGER